MLEVAVVSVCMLLGVGPGNSGNNLSPGAAALAEKAALAAAAAFAKFLDVSSDAVVVTGFEPVDTLRGDSSARAASNVDSSVVQDRLGGGGQTRLNAQREELYFPALAQRKRDQVLQAAPTTPTPSTTPSPGWAAIYVFGCYRLVLVIDLDAASHSSTLHAIAASTNLSGRGSDGIRSSSALDDGSVIQALSAVLSSPLPAPNGANSNTGASSFLSFLINNDSFAQSLGYANASSAGAALSVVVQSDPEQQISITTVTKAVPVFLRPSIAPPAPLTAGECHYAGVIGAAITAVAALVGGVTSLYARVRRSRSITPEKTLGSPMTANAPMAGVPSSPREAETTVTQFLGGNNSGSAARAAAERGGERARGSESGDFFTCNTCALAASGSV